MNRRFIFEVRLSVPEERLNSERHDADSAREQLLADLRQHWPEWNVEMHYHRFHEYTSSPAVEALEKIAAENGGVLMSIKGCRDEN